MISQDNTYIVFDYLGKLGPHLIYPKVLAILKITYKI